MKNTPENNTIIGTGAIAITKGTTTTLTTVQHAYHSSIIAIITICSAPASVKSGWGTASGWVHCK